MSSFCLILALLSTILALPTRSNHTLKEENGSDPSYFDAVDMLEATCTKIDKGCSFTALLSKRLDKRMTVDHKATVKIESSSKFYDWDVQLSQVCPRRTPHFSVLSNTLHPRVGNLLTINGDHHYEKVLHKILCEYGLDATETYRTPTVQDFPTSSKNSSVLVFYPRTTDYHGLMTIDQYDQSVTVHFTVRRRHHVGDLAIGKVRVLLGAPDAKEIPAKKGPLMLM